MRRVAGGKGPQSIEEIAQQIGKRYSIEWDGGGCDLPPTPFIVDLARTLILQISTIASFLGIKVPEPEIVDAIGFRWELPAGRVYLQVFDIHALTYTRHYVTLTLIVWDKDGNEIVDISVQVDAHIEAFYDGLFNWLDRSGDGSRQAAYKKWRESEEGKAAAEAHESYLAELRQEQELPPPPPDTTMMVWELDPIGEPHLCSPFPPPIIGRELIGLTIDQLEEELLDPDLADWCDVPREHFEWVSTVLHNFKIASNIIGVNLPECRISIPSIFRVFGRSTVIPATITWDEKFTGSLSLEYTSLGSKWSGRVSLMCPGSEEDPKRESYTIIWWTVPKHPDKSLIELLKDLFQ